LFDIPAYALILEIADPDSVFLGQRMKKRLEELGVSMDLQTHPGPALAIEAVPVLQIFPAWILVVLALASTETQQVPPGMGVI